MNKDGGFRSPSSPDLGAGTAQASQPSQHQTRSECTETINKRKNIMV